MWRSVVALSLVAVAAAGSTLAGQPQVATAAAPATQVVRDAAPVRAGTAILRGRVVADSPASMPLIKARVTIGGTSADPVFTDGSGRFEFRSLPTGRYTLTAEKTGYARTRYGAQHDLDPALPLDLRDAAVLDDVEIRMPKGAAIAGHIVDELGDPVTGASVSVGSLQRVGNELRFVGASRPASRTNDLGEFRIGGLPAGRYYVSVSGETEGSSVPGGPIEWARATSWARTFYLAAPEISAATSIVLGIGEERTDVSVMLVPVQPAKLSVTLSDASGAPVAGLVNLMQEAERGGALVGNRAVPLSAGPVQRPMIQTLQPGEWIAVGPLGTGPASVTRVVLRSGEEAALNVMAGRPARINGRVIFDGSSSGPAAPAMTSLRVYVRGAGADANVASSMLSPKGSVPISQDGTFEIAEVLGTVTPYLPNLPPGWVLKAVRYAERDLLDEPLTLAGGEDIRGIVMVLSDQVTTVSGVVTDAAGRPVAGCAVTLFPDSDPTARAGISLDGNNLQFGLRRMRLERTDQNGRYRLTDLVAGAYRIVATTDIDAAVWQTTDYLNLLRPGATPITLDGRSAQTTTLQCGSAP